jgi:hypothetical protein
MKSLSMPEMALDIQPDASVHRFKVGDILRLRRWDDNHEHVLLLSLTFFHEWFMVVLETGNNETYDAYAFDNLDPEQVLVG